MKRLSGDPNGRTAFSVPGSGCAEREARARTQSRGVPPESATVKASLRPRRGSVGPADADARAMSRAGVRRAG